MYQWCQTNFTEVFIAWAHLKALRIHVESILRFGLPADYVGAVVKVIYWQILFVWVSRILIYFILF